jgi:CBS domain-containing protein
MSKLQFYQAKDVGELAWPEAVEDISLETSALKFFTDFHDTKPRVIESSVSASDVNEIMLKSHINMEFVVTGDNHFLGIVSAEDIDNRKILLKVSEGFKRDEIMITDMMIPKNELVALAFSELAKATIGDVIDMLKDSGHEHFLVIDQETNKIRGIISAREISRILHLPISIQNKSDFYKVFSATST